MQLLGRFWELRVSVPAGASEVVILPAAARVSVSAAPVAGGAATVEYTVSSADEVNGGTPIWIKLIDAATAGAEANRSVPTRALRLSAATAAAVFDILQWASG
ncbi:MAG: hypothetical protein QJR02_08350 [Sinobacteraceae bacterium]|nr:hypothetical protein [Nevskiaceae bacterium]